MGTSERYDPSRESTIQFMNAAGSDPYFVRLCKIQDCFRARLTPKPWRCRLSRPPGLYPRESPDMQILFQAWLTKYEEACPRYAVCRYVETVGKGSVLEEFRDLVTYHDQTTRSNESSLPLA